MNCQNYSLLYFYRQVQLSRAKLLLFCSTQGSWGEKNWNIFLYTAAVDMPGLDPDCSLTRGSSVPNNLNFSNSLLSVSSWELECTELNEGSGLWRYLYNHYLKLDHQAWSWYVLVKVRTISQSVLWDLEALSIIWIHRYVIFPSCLILGWDMGPLTSFQ